MEILNIRHWTAPDHTRIVLDVNAEPVYDVKEDKNFVALNFKNASFNTEIPGEMLLNQPGIKKIVFKEIDKGNVKVEFHLDEHQTIVIFKLKKFQGRPDRVVVDIMLQVSAVQEEVTSVTKPVIKRERIIVIDPGHGGEDPGAISKRGVYEKDIVLTIGREIKKEIDKIPDFRAVLTRKGDYYVSFSKRLQKAKDIDASLFISVHADAARNRKAKGSTVYSLSTGGASSEAAKLLATNENLSDIVGGVPDSEGKNEFDPIILNMFQTNTINLSRKYAGVLINQLNKINCVKFKSVQEAPFRVLKLPDIPAVLLEAAYLSNPHEERLLRDRDFQKKIAVAVASSVCKYFIGSSSLYENIKKAENQRKKSIKSTTINYKVKKGDTLSSIASSHNTSIAILLKLNDMKLNDKIYAGEKIIVPAAGVQFFGSQATVNYKVEKGDTLSSIAACYNTSIAILLKLNDMQLNDRIYAGRKILVPIAGGEVLHSKSTMNYRVKKGDTLSSIANNHNTSIAALLKLNNMKLNDRIYSGRKLLVPVAAGDDQFASARDFRHYTVEKGDTLYSLAKNNSTTIKKLQELNNMERDDILYCGQKIKLPQ